MKTEQVIRITRALADPRRMAILQRIAAEKEMACSALARRCPVSQPTVSHHIKELLTAGLIKARRQAKYFYYRLDQKVWARYVAEMRRRIPTRPNIC